MSDTPKQALSDKQIIALAEKQGWHFRTPSGNPNRDYWEGPNGERVYNFLALRKAVKA
jgi:hypothetical protein